LQPQPGGVSNGTNKVANFQATKDKYELSHLQTSNKPVINQDNARMSTSQKTRAQKISEDIGESTTKKIYTQKISGSKTTEKPAQQNGSSSSSINRNNNTNSSNKNRNSSASGGNFNSSNKTSNMNSSNSSKEISNMNSSNTSNNASIAAARKNNLRADNMDFDFSSGLNSTKEVTKRNSANKLFTAESQDSSKPIEIEVKTYTAPPNASAIIEVRPEKPVTNEMDSLNNPDQNLWALYQYQYPQEINGPQAWYLQQYQPSLPSSLTYVPTEELLHSQSFSNTPGFGSQLLYQYPVKEAVNKKQGFSPRSKYMFSNLRNDNEKIPKPDPKDYHKLLPNHAVEPLARISPHQFGTPPQIQHSLPPDFFPPYFLRHTNGIQNSFYKQGESNLNSNPTVTKYVTNSYVLKTHPKLEWVPL
jgi:hypothetical protein